MQRFEEMLTVADDHLKALHAVQSDETAAPRLPFEPPPPAVEDTREASADLHDAGFSVLAIAQFRGLEPGTIIGHLEDLAKQGRHFDLSPDLPGPDRLATLAAAFDRLGDEEIVPIYEALNGKFSYAEIRVTRIHQRQLGNAGPSAQRDEQGPMRALL